MARKKKRKRRKGRGKRIVGGVALSGAALAAALALRRRKQRKRDLAKTRGLNLEKLAKNPALSLAERIEVALLPKKRGITRAQARLRTRNILAGPAAAARRLLGR